MRAWLAAVMAVGLAAAGPARAHTTTVSGSQLVLTDTLRDQVIIGTDPSLHGEMRISLDAPLSCLTIVSGSTVVVSTSRCGEDSGRLRIEVSPDTPVTLSSTSDETVHVGDLRAPLVASFTGAGDLMAGRTGGLVLALRGHTDVYAGEVDGPATVEIGGANDVRIKQVNGALTVKQVAPAIWWWGIAADSVTLEANGSGDMLIGSGQIGMLTARLHGRGDLSVAASIRDANVEALGGGDAKLGPVSGQLMRNAGGGSTIVVGGSDMVRSVTSEATRRAGSSGGSSSRGTGPHVLGHVLAFGFVVLVGYISWRIIRQSRRQAPTAAPTNQALVALGATLARLDQRLGRVEEYVTTREFDLNRKFREL